MFTNGKKLLGKMSPVKFLGVFVAVATAVGITSVQGVYFRDFNRLRRASLCKLARTEGIKSTLCPDRSKSRSPTPSPKRCVPTGRKGRDLA